MASFDKKIAADIKDYLDYRRKGGGGGEGISGLFAMAAIYRDFRKSRPDLRKNSPGGDGHPVLVIPAFTSNDILTRPLRRILEAKGYKAYGWEGNFNLGMNDKKAKHLRDFLEKTYKENGNRKVTLIGHSLGGIYARILAQEYPEMVRAVITVNSPFGVGVYKDAVPPLVTTMIDTLSHERYSLNGKDAAERLLTPPPVPTTSIFSKTDAVASYKACLNPKTPLSENVEIDSPHIASILHKDTMEVILDRLAQPEGQWTPHKNASTEPRPPNPNWKPPAHPWRVF